MAVEVCHDAWTRVACLYDNTTDTAFGPVFKGIGAGIEAEDFLEWLRENGHLSTAERYSRFKMGGWDARDYTERGLRDVLKKWRDQYVPAVPEPQSLRVDYEEGRTQT